MTQTHKQSCPKANPATGLAINEIFWSFQGEGQRAGVPSIFIRLAGCSLKCPYCDQADAWSGGEFLSIEDILGRVEPLHRKYPDSQAVITGGEPLEQDISALVSQLKDQGLFVAIETNGNHFRDVPIDWWTVSPKDASQYFIEPRLAGKINEVKLIVNQNLTMERVKEIRAQLEKRSAGSVPVFLQPDAAAAGSPPGNYQSVFDLYCRCQETGIKNIRAGVQLHKIYNVQ